MPIKKIITSCTLVTLLVSCYQAADLNYVKSNLWQWDSGYKIGEGDFVEFDSTNYYKLSHDTIFKEGVPKCVVVSTDSGNNEMNIKSFTGESGLYINTSEFTK